MRQTFYKFVQLLLRVASNQKNEGMPDAHGEYQPIPLQNRSKTIKHAEKHIEFIELPQREM